MLAKVLQSKIAVSISLFFLAFIPRLLDLGRFLTADEFLWIDRSRNFLGGLTNNAFQCTSVVEEWGHVAEGLACTLRTGHPGVTTMWTGSLGLWLSWLARGGRNSLYDFLLNVSTNPVEASLIAPTRFGTVLITSVWVVVVYWLLRRLFGGQIALIAALFLALSPFHIALSRVIHHDALSTTFMTLSALTALIYWGQQESRRWWVASGLLAGFGFLSKSPALYLMPFVGLVGIWFTAQGLKNKSVADNFVTDNFVADNFVADNFVAMPPPYIAALKRLILDGLLWFGLAIAIVFIVWPAMWAVPWQAISTVLFIGSKYATGGHAKGNFFLGQVSTDPGPLFYPVTWFFRVSPLVMLGVLLLPVAWFLFRKQAKAKHSDAPEQSDDFFAFQPQLFMRYVPLSLLFIAGYYLMMTIGEKKQDRYFLPVYPWFNILAAMGWLGALNYIWAYLTKGSTVRTPSLKVATQITAAVVSIIILVNGFLVVRHYPYYFTYYNPLLGGPPQAAQVLTVGWGEGMDVVADYLNHNTNPSQTRVASWYESTLAPFYYGPTISYSKEKGKALAGHYTVFYINQVQRRFPDEVIFDFFERFPPSYVVSLHGVDYAWIYPSFRVDHYVEDQTYTGIASLLAWEWSQGDQEFAPGQAVGFEVYWEYLGKALAEPFFVRLLDNQGHTVTEAVSTLNEQFNPPLASWRQGEILFENGTLPIPLGTPPGLYQLQIGFKTKAPAVTTGELLFDIPPDEALVEVGHGSRLDFQLSSLNTSINEPLGADLILLGGNWPQTVVAPGDNMSIDLFWQVVQPISAEAEVHMGLMAENNEAQQAWFNLSLAETFNPTETTWQPGDIIHTTWQLGLLPDLPPGQYRLELVHPNNTEQTLSFTEFVVE